MNRSDSNFRYFKMLPKWLVQLIPYLIVYSLAFYIIPGIQRDKDIYALFLILGFPLICLIMGVIRGRVWGIDEIMSILVALLFIPVVYIHYNDSALIYSFYYGIITFVSTIIGRLMKYFSENIV